ncbi:MAG: hypothetical protein ABJP48_04380 [Erythrobacter sp.]
MSRAIAISRQVHVIALERQFELARIALVFGCAGALILAGQPLPL